MKKIRIAHITDTHIGVTPARQLEKMIVRLAKEKFDVVIHTGDFCGGVRGSRSVQTTLKLLRRLLPPNTVIAATIGNHDLWWRGQSKKSEDHIITRGHRWCRPSLFEYTANMEAIRTAMKESGVHYFDEDGPLRLGGFPGVAFVGVMGWYKRVKVETNDHNYLPVGIEGDTHRYLQLLALRNLYKNIDQLDVSKDREVIFVSHFPVVKAGYDPGFEDFCWDEGIAEMMRENYKTQYFLCGHAHQHHKGPERFEPGSDYANPNYEIWELGCRDDLVESELDQASVVEGVE